MGINNFQERRTLLYRFIGSFLLILSLGLTIFSVVYTIIKQPGDMAIALITTILTSLFTILQIIFILKGWKKESNLNKIAFNENEKLNTVPIFAVSIGMAIAIVLLSLGLSVFFIKDNLTIKCAMLVVSSVGGYLLANCITYFVYLILFRKREVNLKDFIK